MEEQEKNTQGTLMKLIEERRSQNVTIIAVSTIVSLFVGMVGILSYIQSGERRTTQMEVKLETLIKEIEGLKQDLRIDRNRQDIRGKEKL